MSYRIEQNKESGERELVIDGWDKGIADSPYTGITSIKNLNVTFLPGATYVNYKRKPVTLTGATMGTPKFYAQSPGSTPVYYILDDKGQVWYSGGGGGATWSLLTGNHTSTGNLGQGLAYYKDYLFVFGNNYVDVCGDGTGVGHITSAYWSNIGSSGYYLSNHTSVYLTVAPVLGASSITLSSTWPYISGVYSVTMGAGAQIVQGSFTFGSATVNITPVVSITTSITYIDANIFVVASDTPNHMAMVANGDILYFCNGNSIGRISPPTASTTNIFKVSDFTTQYVNFSFIPLRQNDRAIWLAELSTSTTNLLIAVQNYIYTWNEQFSLVATYFPVTTLTQTPINENPSRMINILNNIYIFAGMKGNVYISNGYSVSLFKKLPDSFLGVIDPYWIIGGMMFHRNKLWFGAVVACGTNVSALTAIQGIFSLVLVGGSTQTSLETSGALTFESQNSWGISAPNNSDGTGVLIDLNANPGRAVGSTLSNSGADCYQSAWFNGTTGGIDYNDTTPWGNWEPAIETDLVPMGTFLTAQTLSQVEFKLDRPMVSGDQIRLSYRESFTDSYTAIGTTTTSVLSDIYNSGVNTAQWVQFKVEFKCASSNSSFIPLREIRLHYGN